MASKLDSECKSSDVTRSQFDTEAKGSSSGHSSLEAMSSSSAWRSLLKQLKKASTKKNAINHLLGNPKTPPLLWLLPSTMPDSSTIVQIRQWHTAAFASGELCKKSCAKSCKKACGKVTGKTDKKAGKTAGMIANRIGEFVGQIESSVFDLDTALAMLGAAYSARMCIGQLDESQGPKLVRDLGRLADSIKLNAADDPWLYQLGCIELPLVLAFQFGATGKRKKVAKPAFRELETFVTQILDTDGWLKAEFLPVFGPLVASWARSCAISSELGMEMAPEPARSLERAVGNTIRLSRPNGTLMGSPQTSNPVNSKSMKTVLQLLSDPLDRKTAKINSSGKNKTIRSHQKRSGDSSHSEWVKIGVFQRDRKRKSPRCAFTYHDSKFWMEVCRHNSLLDGDCTPQVSLNGSVLKADSEFILTNEDHSDSVDYLELEIGFGHGVTLKRQLVFAKQDKFLIVSDVIKSPEPVRLDYRCEFPLGEGIEGMAETETREYYLKDSKIRSLVLPLALPEWKIDKSEDQLECQDRRLILSQSIVGCGLFAGLFFDLSPKRSVRPRTWRSITVAEQLKIVDRDAAVAFRIQIGREQWVVYRTVARKGNRTFLGENVISDYFVGRFERNGEVTELLQIG